MVLGYFIQCMVKLARWYQAHHKQTDLSVSRLARALVHIETNYAEEISIEELASLVNLSVRHFRRLFQDVYKTSPIEYVIETRMRKASMLLLHNDYNMTEIA